MTLELYEGNGALVPDVFIPSVWHANAAWIHKRFRHACEFGIYLCSGTLERTGLQSAVDALDNFGLITVIGALNTFDFYT